MTAISRTAWAVAESVVSLARDEQFATVLPTGLVAHTEGLLRAVDPGLGFFGLGARLAASAPFRAACRTYERVVFPGLGLHVGLRKRAIDDGVRAALRTGTTRLVVLGSGLDTLALRIAVEHPEVQCVEADLPATLEAKRRALAQLGHHLPNLELVELDLNTDDLEQIMMSPEPTVFVAEGLFMYLPADGVDRVLRGMGEAPRGSRLVFTYMGRDARGKPVFDRFSRAVSLQLLLIREPFRWGASPSELTELLGRVGLERREELSRPDFVMRYLEPLGIGSARLPDFERVVTVESAHEVRESRPAGD